MGVKVTGDTSKIEYLLKNMAGITRGAQYELSTQMFDMSQDLVPRDTEELAESGYNTKTETGAEWGYTAEHAPHVELGTMHQAAQPFNRPAYDHLKGEIVKLMKEGVKEAVGG